MISLNTVKNEIVIEFEEKKSKFLGYIKPVQSVKDAEDFINNIKKFNQKRNTTVRIIGLMKMEKNNFRFI